MLLVLLPCYGALTLGMHAGFAVYFPELFPHHLRSTGAGFCFNGGRLLAALMLVFSGWLKSLPGMDLRLAVTLLGLLFLQRIIHSPFGHVLRAVGGVECTQARPRAPCARPGGNAIRPAGSRPAPRLVIARNRTRPPFHAR